MIPIRPAKLRPLIGDETISPICPIGFRGFSEGFDSSQVPVIRYMPFSRFLSLIKYNAVWFSRLGALNDKFEGTDPRGTRGFVLKLADDARAIDKCKAMGLWDTMNWLAENKPAGGDAARIMFVVNCWYMGQPESANMWKVFGDEGKGVAIRSTISRLATAFFIPDGLKPASAVGRVNYVDFKSHQCHDGNNTSEVAFLKDKSLAHENEVRVLTLNNCLSSYLNSEGSALWRSGLPRFVPNLKGFNIQCDLQSLIQSVIAGPNTLPGDRDMMKRLVDGNGRPVKIEESALSPWQ